MDKIFLDCIREIEKNYVTFPKVNRLRIEKWIEKLALSSNTNPTWRRHRDLYVKLLLSQVMSKKLEDPFNKFPPDGPLLTFPSDKIHSIRDLLGSRESKFWREIHDIISNKEVVTDSMLMQNILTQKRISSAMIPGKEVQNLTLLLKEQANRIRILEDQLHEERVRHELEMQKVMLKLQAQQEEILYFSSMHTRPELWKENNASMSNEAISINRTVHSKLDDYADSAPSKTCDAEDDLPSAIRPQQANSSVVQVTTGSNFSNDEIMTSIRPNNSSNPGRSADVQKEGPRSHTKVAARSRSELPIDASTSHGRTPALHKRRPKLHSDTYFDDYTSRSSQNFILSDHQKDISSPVSRASDIYGRGYDPDIDRDQSQPINGRRYDNEKFRDHSQPDGPTVAELGASKRVVWRNYMQYLDQFQEDLKTLHL